MKIWVDRDRCVGCKLCFKACPFEAIEIIDKKAVINDNCTFCRACLEACGKYQAIILEEDEVAKPAEVQKAEGVWVVTEKEPSGQFNPVSFELIGKGRELADQLGQSLTAVVIGDGDEDSVAPLGRYPVDEILLISHPELKDFTEENYSAALSNAARQSRPAVLLCGATSYGRAFFPRVAADLKTGLTADCTGLVIDRETGNLVQTRPAFGGNLMASILCPVRRPQMSTVRPQVFPKPEPASPRTVKIRKSSPQELPGLSTLLEFIEDKDDTVSIAEAPIIVSGGRGMGGPESFEILHKLASLLGGAVGASRAAVDADWISYPHQVGQTGRTVSPKLYLACGISGAIQHLAGMQSSKTIVAINKDPEAPIFKVADLGIVGDLFDVVPRLIKSLEKRKSRGD